jgi:hypothetical protein
MDSNDVHRHKHWHMHTHHYIARICMFRCMFRIVCLDVCLGFILRKNQFSKQMWTTSLKPFPNKPWDPISHCIFLFHFLNQISMNSNPILTIFCNSLIQPHSFLKFSCLQGLSISILQNPIFKLKINQQK